MALIEHLERDGWREFLCSTFEYTLDVLKNDRFRQIGSAADDLRSWLAAGGVARVRAYLNEQMERRQFSTARQTEVNKCLEYLVRKHRGLLLELIAQGILPATLQEKLACLDFSESELMDLFARVLAGERPFEDWMRSNGRSEQEIAEIYQIIDQWLLDEGLIRPPKPAPDSYLH